MATPDAATVPPRPVPIVNPANLITASRYFTLPPFIWALEHGHRQIAVVALIVCGLFDKLDGRFAKWFHCKSAFGELFDAITDGICYGTLMIVVAAYGLAPPVAVGLIVGMGFYNSVLRVFYSKRAGRPTNYKSPGVERSAAYAAFLIGFALADFETAYFFWLFVAVLLVLFARDTKRMLIDPIPPAPGMLPLEAK